MSNSQLELPDYRKAISLDEPLNPRLNTSSLNHLKSVLQELDLQVPDNVRTEEALRVLHGALASIDPFQLSPTLVDKIESIASTINAQAVPVDPLSLPSIATQYKTEYSIADVASIWVGDITQIRADAIVNAANIEMLGCRIPNHSCIDNAIHSAAGPRLRDDCALIMNRQGAHEQIGKAKITRGYALPSRYVLHTVGPQLRPGAQPTSSEHDHLANAYRSCLDLASQVDNLKTITFCAISTGVFSYPRKMAAAVALKTVADWINAHPGRFDRIVFNLYSVNDATVYEDLLSHWSHHAT